MEGERGRVETRESISLSSEFIRRGKREMEGWEGRGETRRPWGEEKKTGGEGIKEITN